MKQSHTEHISGDQREDIRHLPVFTIDPDTAKDFDDALSIVPLENKDGVRVSNWYELGVHIADVGHFLPFNSPTDKKAQEKATSIYLVEKCIPMLPPHLSEDACSLVPHADRNTFSVFFEINERGEIRRTRFAKTLIHSKHRFTYSTAQRVLDTREGPHVKDLLLLETITRKLRADRFAHGAIEFTNEEVQFHINERGEPTALHKKTLLYSMQLIEECMLLANVAAGELLTKAVKEKKLPLAVYRVHDGPTGEKLLFLRSMLDTLHIPFHTHGKTIHGKDIQRAAKAAKDKGLSQTVDMVLLRSMGKATYSTEHRRHFGLGFPTYTHFTSPIRRYPDVMVHRLLWAYLSNTRISGQEARLYAKMCDHSTEMEIAAQEAERDSIKEYQVRYLAKHVGKKCEGVITGIMPFGMFVRDNDTLAEGFIHVRSLPDYVTHHEKTRTLKGKRGTYQLGDSISFSIKKVDTVLNRIDCEIS